MPSRYLVLAGERPDLVARIGAEIHRFNLTPVMASNSLHVWASSDLSVIALNESQGVILGELFDANYPFETVVTIRPDIQSSFARDKSRKSLVEAFWGNYLAIFQDENQNTSTAVRAPFGQLPSYYMTVDGATLFASDISIFSQLALLDVAIDWATLVEHVIAPNLRRGPTCLAGIDELIGGFGLSVSGSASKSFEVWNPWSFTGVDQHISNDSDSVPLLRSTIDAVVAALARKTKRAVLGVSGGLDSSVVAAALAANGTPFSCLTLFTKDAAGDERQFARSLARHLGVELFEVLEEPANVDLTRSDAAHLPRPIARSFAQSGNRSNLVVARQTGADDFFSGGGGDNVFCSLQSAAPVADCLLTSQLAAAWQTAGDVAQIAECSVIHVLRNALRRTAFGPRTYRWRPELGFLNQDLATSAERACTPPWAAAPRYALPGKATHIAYLVGIMNHIEGFGRERTHRMVWPLLAQPLVELCLRIPSWVWSKGGINRALVRRAYSDALPVDILDRRKKGTPDCFVAELFESNRHLIRSFLCDGHLAEQGILDREAVARFLADDAPVRDLAYWRIMTLTDVEAWTWSPGTASAI